VVSIAAIFRDISERKQAELTLQRETRRHRALMETAIDGIHIVDQSGALVEANAAFLRMIGYEHDEAIGFHVTDWDAKLSREEISARIASVQTRSEIFETRFRRKDGSIRDVEVSASALEIEGVVWFYCAARDISERKFQEQKIRRLSRIHAVLSGINSLIVRVRDRQELFNESCRIVVEHGGFGIAWIGLLDRDTLDVNLVAWAGIDAESFPHAPYTARSDVPQGPGNIGRAIRDKRPVIVNDLAAPDLAFAKGPRVIEAIRRGYGSLAVFPLLIDDSVAGILSMFAQEQNFFTEDELKLLTELAADISFALGYIAKEEKLNYLAYYDALTGLPNRTLLDDRMAQRLRTASHENSKVALVVIDLEHFRDINNTLGRHAADALLRLVAERLQSVVFDRDSLARLSTDIFATLFPDIKDEADVARIMEEKLIACLSRPFTVDGQELRVSMKAGVALFPGDGMQPDALFRNAEAALKQAKESGERYVFYAPQMNARVAERLKLENKLRQALDRDEFVLYYQPKVDLRTGRVAGFEALIRWNDPDTGLVPPMEFIPLLEETGMIVEVGAWVMKQAVTQHAAWQAAGLPPLPIAVNVSQAQLRRKEFVASVQQALVLAGESGHGLELEITESMIMEDIESSIEKLKLVRDLGVEISIDDFGTGYSSLRYLARLPITALKIDRAFIQHMATNPGDAAIVSTIIVLGRTLKLKVIAEGVETGEQRDLLKRLKCDEMQGYLFSKPVPAEQVPALLAPRRGR